MSEAGNPRLGAPSPKPPSTPVSTSSFSLTKSWRTSASDGWRRSVGRFFKRSWPVKGSTSKSSGAQPDIPTTAAVPSPRLRPDTTARRLSPRGLAPSPVAHDASWDAKRNAFRSLVGQDCYMEIQFTTSIDQLETYTQNFKANSATHLSPESLKRVDVVVDGLKALVGIATALAPTSSEIGTMIWGSTRLIFENSRNYAQLADLVLGHFTPITQKFEPFERYLSMFPDSKPLGRAVEVFCLSVVHFLGHCVNIQKRHWLGLPILAGIDESLRKMVKKINHESDHVEREFQVAKFQADELRWKMHGNALIPTRQPLEPSCFDVPVNRTFCGREDITQQLRDHLMGPEGKPRPGGSALLYGLGGMGKSSVAVKFVYDHMDTFNRRIFWFSVDTRQKALMTAARACRALGMELGDHSHELAKAPSAWRGWLEQHDSWLVVYDNVEDEDLLWELWPRTTRGTIIVTSRRPEVTGTLLQNSVEIDVGALPLSETRKLLFELLPPKYADLSTNPEQVSIANQICELLDGLPLAVVLAAALMKQTLRSSCSLAETLKLLTEKRGLLMEWNLSSKGTASLPLGMLWEANIASLPESSRTLLQTMAFLDPDKVQEEMFLDSRVSTLHNALLPDDGSYLQCLRSLNEYCLVRRDNAMVSVHRLVQQATIHRMDPMTDLPAAFNAAVDLIWTLFPRQSKNGLLMSSVLHVAQDYLPHVEALGSRYREVGRSIGYKSQHLAELIYDCSWTMHERGMLEPAIKLARTGLEIAEALSSETRLLRADLWTTIGAAQVAGSLVEESYVSLERALNLRLSAVEAGLMDGTHPQIANSYMSLGTAAVGISRRVQEAIELGEKSILLRQGRAEEQIQMLALSHHNVALATLTCGQLEKADEFIDKSMEISAETCQSMTPEQKMAMDSRNIYCKGNILWARGMKKEAREYHANALQVRLRTFGETHPYTACAYWKLGQVWEEDDWEKAEEHYKSSVGLYERLTMVEACLGRVLLHLGRLRGKHGDPGGSENIARAQSLFTKITGDKFPEIEDGDSSNPFARLIHPFYS